MQKMRQGDSFWTFVFLKILCEVDASGQHIVVSVYFGSTRLGYDFSKKMSGPSFSIKFCVCFSSKLFC